jgi:cell division protein FtsI (penicillin-binding protein 3)
MPAFKILGPELPPRQTVEPRQEPRHDSLKMRTAVATAAMLLAFFGIGGQLVRLGIQGQGEVRISMNEPIATNFARPDIVDRNGRLLATDVFAQSLFADPSVIDNRDEVVEKLLPHLPGLKESDLRKALADRDRRFAWIWRGLSPKDAQVIHDLGIPGLQFRPELRRAYPGGNIAGHILGQVTIDNRGVAGIERYVDDVVGVEPVHGITLGEQTPVRLSIDLGVQHALESELKSAMKDYGTKGAAGLIMDVNTGEVLASASMPDVDPAVPEMSLDPKRIDRISEGTYELGSIFKALTIAMALDGGIARLDTMLDVREPLKVGRYTIKDLHPAGRPLSVAEVFIHSSNVGAGMLALEAGTDRLRDFLARAHLTDVVRTELGPVAAPQVPERWGRAETITVAYGHGLAVAPIQFAAAAAALINGGERIEPTFVRRAPGAAVPRERLVSRETSALINAILRRNVTDPQGTGKRADVPGYRVGGKTGTAEIAGRGGYKKHAVISSFLAAFPMDQPKYLVLVSLFEPQPSKKTHGHVTAGLTAAPVAGQLIARVAPVLGVMPENDATASIQRSGFDAYADAE